MTEALATAKPTGAMAETMGDHSYDYDLIVIGGGSGGLVRARPSETARRDAARQLIHFQKNTCPAEDLRGPSEITPAFSPSPSSC